MPGFRAGPLVVLVLGLLLGALSLLVMLPAAQHLRSFQDGERARATLLTNGPCMTGRCKVAFEVEGRAVVAELPVGSGGRHGSAGTRLTIRYRTDDLRAVATERDLSGGGAAVLTVGSGAAGLFFVVMSVWSAVLARRRPAEPVRGPASRRGGRTAAECPGRGITAARTPPRQVRRPGLPGPVEPGRTPPGGS
ncbi:hypothetical protein ACN9M0_28550 [Streptomyces sp. R-07]|uniref:hypothetical protein n=1 Tax=Streptomyces sp. R-07 TaxID=3404052 RepID=UPI003CE9C6A3